MNTKHYLLVSILLLGFAAFSTAQEKLERDLIMFRVNDTITKQQVEYKHPGRIGANVLWDFSELKPTDDKYKLIYTNDNSSSSTIVGIEHRTRYYYQLVNDSLFLCGFENSTTKINNLRPELLMSFPLTYQKSTFAYYNGQGEYSKVLNVATQGSIKTKVDAYGMIILPNKDTLKNVVRLQTNKLIAENIRPINALKNEYRNNTLQNYVPNDTIQYHLKNDTALVLVRNYKWFAAGYRYPIFETIQTRNYKDSLQSEFFSTAFFYPPDEHYYLVSDTKNKQLQEKLKDKEKKKKKDEDKEPLNFRYNIFPNPVHTQLSIEYYISKDATIGYVLYNLSGQVVWTLPAQNKRNGVYRETINMSGYMQGEYILQIIVDDKSYSEKIIKS